MFDDFSFDSAPSGFTISGGDGALGYDTSGLGAWGTPDLGSGVLASLDGWGTDYQNSLAPYLAQGALGASYPASGGYATSGLGSWAQQGQPAEQVVGQQPQASSSSSQERQNAVLKALGMKATSDGTSTDWSNPQTLAQLIKLAGVGGNFLQKALASRQQAQQQAGVLQQALSAQSKQTWTPQQAAIVNSFLNSGYTPVSQRRLSYASDAPSPIVASRGYARGGEVQPGEPVAPLSHPQGYLAGATDGQADQVPADLSHGEYVLDADTVAALGNGNNEAGAQVLDAWRERIRAHKWSAPPDQIPPKAKRPEHYLKGAK